MKAIFVLFDSLNRHMLPPYNPQTWVHAPNFRRLAQRTVQFQRAYVCSMPCMPARREIHTGRPNFLHRSWGPLEPFDDSMPQILKEAGVHTHLSTDHYHYFEDGGATYHTKYSTWEFHRGQEGDPWMGVVDGPKAPDCVAARSGQMWEQDWINRAYMRYEEDQPQPKTFKAGIDYIRRNRDKDRWMVQIETFDPHEPFFSQRKYKDLYARHYDNYKGRHFDWPPYRKVEETPEEIEHCRHEYAALMSMCDHYLGEILDLMDELDLWKDTMLIVGTDHGFMLGEHECWAKIWMPFYEEVAHVPLWVWDPRCGKRNEKREALVQTIDFAPTLLEYFGVEVPKDMTGKPLRQTIASDKLVRQAGIFGIHGGHVNVTDGRYVYMRAATDPATQELYEYTVMPTHMRGPFRVEELQRTVGLAEPFSFTKGCKTMKIRCGQHWLTERGDIGKTWLYDVQADPQQTQPLNDPAIEKRMIEHLVREMKACDAPAEQFARLGLG